MKNFLDGLAGMLMVSADRARNRRTLRRIQEANEQNQGIVRYAPSQIEAFLDDAAPMGDLLISGGANAIRVRAVCRAIECACQQGYSVMVLHAGNSELEQGLWGYFGGSGVCLVNQGNPVYDPFFGASNGEIARLVVDSSEKGCQVHPAGRYYLYGISDYILTFSRRMPWKTISQSRLLKTRIRLSWRPLQPAPRKGTRMPSAQPPKPIHKPPAAMIPAVKPRRRLLPPRKKQREKAGSANYFQNVTVNRQHGFNRAVLVEERLFQGRKSGGWQSCQRPLPLSRCDNAGFCTFPWKIAGVPSARAVTQS